MSLSALSSQPGEPLRGFREAIRQAEETAGRMSGEELAEAVGELERMKGLLWLRLNRKAIAEPQGPDRLLSAEEAAGRLGVSPETVYRKAKSLPFRVKVGGSLRFSSVGIDAWIRSRRGR